MKTRNEDTEAKDDCARERQIAHLSLNFVLEMVSHGVPGLKPLESLLMMAINQANIAPLTRDREARIRYGALDAPAPDDERRPVSVRAIAASMQLPYETARRNVRRLEQKGVCVTSEAGVVVPAAFLTSPGYFQAAQLGHERLHTLYRNLTKRQLLEALPPPAYDETEPPVRGAVRLLADYLLRTADVVVARGGELAAALVLLPQIAASAGLEDDAAAPLSVAAIARRIQLPAETVRRHVASLIASGECISMPGGVGLADPSLVSPVWRDFLRSNAVAVQRMFAGLAERGVVAVWREMAEAATSARGAA